MSNHLEQLMARAAADIREEPAFFRALLKATIYAHIPLTDRIDAKSVKIRFIQFHTPDTRKLVLPFFSSEAKARIAAQSTVQVVAMNGRVLFELTRGATLMLDPNDCRCTLYPEEITALLTTGRVPQIQHFTIQENAEPSVGAPLDSPAWLIEALSSALSKLPFVNSAYLAGVYSKDAVPQQQGIVVALVGDPSCAERSVHAALAVVQPLCEQHSDYSIDMTHFDATGPLPEWIVMLGLQPFYDRSWGARLHDDNQTTVGSVN